MSEPIDIQAQLLALLQRMPANAPAVTGIAPAFGAPPPISALPSPVGLLIPVSLQTRDGEVTAYMQFGPDVASAQLVPLLEALSAAGWPIKAWRRKEENGGNRDSRFGGGGGGRGGWGR